VTELPLRIVDQAGGPVIRCLCGAELAVMKRGLTNELIGLRRSDYQPRLSPDLTPAGVMRMVLHAKTCVRGQNKLLELSRPSEKHLT
jgi:hypothetical protein